MEKHTQSSVGDLNDLIMRRMRVDSINDVQGILGSGGK